MLGFRIESFWVVTPCNDMVLILHPRENLKSRMKYGLYFTDSNKNKCNIQLQRIID